MSHEITNTRAQQTDELMTNPLLFVSSRSKWHRSWKTRTQSRRQDCTLNTRLNVTCWKTWGMNTSASHACTKTMWSQSWYTHQLREDLKSSHHYWLWCARHANLDTATNNERERRKQLMSEGGVAWERKRGGGMLSYSSFLRRTKGRENDEGISCCPLPAGWLCFFLPLFLIFLILFCISLCHLFLFPRLHFFYVSFALTIFLSKVSISLLFILAQLCLLMTCESGNFPFWFWQWEENPGSFTRSRFLCWLSIDYLWQKTLKYSLACLHPSLSFSVFLTFTLSPALLSLWDFPLVSLSHSSFHSWGQLQLFENRLPCCCWVWEREQGPGLTCGREGEPV